jgi:hypothetical protein
MARVKTHRITYRSVRRRGKKDGRDWRWKFWPPKWPFREPKEPSPTEDQDKPAQFELTLKEAAEAEMQWIAEEWRAADEKLKADYCRAQAERKQAKEQYDKEAQEATAAMGVYQKASEELAKISSPALSPSWMIFWLIVIGIGEFPLNAIVFDILGHERTETYLVAAFIGIFFPLAAHVFGSALRQEIKSTTDKVLTAIAPVVVLAFLAVIGFLRAKFFETLKLQELLGITVTPTQATILFIVINVAVFFVAAVISYEGTHANRKEYKTLRRKLKEAFRSLKKESAEAKAAATRLAKAEEWYQQALHRRQKNFERVAERARLIKENNDWLIQVYRDANVEARRNASTPACFKEPPIEAQIPAGLQNLDWNGSEPAAGSQT